MALRQCEIGCSRFEDLGHLQPLKYTTLSRNVGNGNYQLTQSRVAEERNIPTQRCSNLKTRKMQCFL
jgi:hypothetical protein